MRSIPTQTRNRIDSILNGLFVHGAHFCDIHQDLDGLSRFQLIPGGHLIPDTQLINANAIDFADSA